MSEPPPPDDDEGPETWPEMASTDALWYGTCAVNYALLANESYAKGLPHEAEDNWASCLALRDEIVEHDLRRTTLDLFDVLYPSFAARWFYRRAQGWTV